MERVLPGFLWGLLPLLAAQWLPAAEQPKPARPNFLVIVADDMGFSDPGCYGGEIATPNLDRLAAGGLRFTQCYSTARCWPSRTCLLTGYYAQQVGMDPVAKPPHLPGWARVLPHYLAPHGYRCYQSGKWHLLAAPKVVADGGFHHSYVLHDHDRYFSPKKHELDDRPLPAVPDGSDFYVTRAIAGHAIDFLQEHARKHAEEPFLLYLAFTSPHFPLQALQEDIDRYRDRYLEGWDSIRQKRWQRLQELKIAAGELPPREPDVIPPWNFSAEQLRADIGPGEVPRAIAWTELTDQQKRFQATKMAIHAAMVDRMDREIGRVLKQVEDMKAWENTVIFFVSDNGASAEQIIRGDKNDPAAPPGSAKSYLCLGPGWSTASNTPFRLHKSWVHEGGISSPLIVHWPKGISTGNQFRRTPCHFVDLAPTLLDLAGVKWEPKYNGFTAVPLPGKSLVPALAADTTIARDYLFFHHLDNKAIRTGDWKLVSKGDGPWELYNLAAGRSETKNRAADEPKRLEAMRETWERAEKQFAEDAKTGQRLWQTDFKAAQEKAVAEKKLLLVDFTGSDWCGWCIRLREEVFDTPLFRQEGPKHFVLVELDFPRGKELPKRLQKQNDALAERYQVEGFPTILLLNPEGKVIARTGYERGGPKAYLAHLAEFREAYQEVVAGREKLATATGLDRARLLDRLMEAYDRLGHPAPESSRWIGEIVALDGKNEAGLKQKYEYRRVMDEARKLLEQEKFAEARRALDQALALSGLTGQQRQEALLAKANTFFREENLRSAAATLEKAIAADPESPKTSRIKRLLGRVRDELEGEKDSKKR